MMTWPNANDICKQCGTVRLGHDLRMAHHFEGEAEKMTDEKIVGSPVFTEDMKLTPKDLIKPAGELIMHNTAELGAAIHAEAMEREKKARQDKIIAEVQRLERGRLEYANQAEFAARATQWYALKLEAIRTGAFDFDLATGEMLFHDDELERANF